MQIHRYGYGIRGFGRLSNYGLRFMVMVSDKAQYGCEVLRFSEKYGLAPILEVFNVKPHTLYHWRRQLRMEGVI